MLANRVFLAAGGGRLDRYTKSLLHFNGTQDSTNFKDEANNTWTANKGSGSIFPIIDRSQYKFGGASGFFKGGQLDLTSSNRSKFFLTNQSFTIDFWYRYTWSSRGQGQLLCFENNYEILLYQNDGDIYMKLRIYITSTNYFDYSFKIEPSEYYYHNEWHHYAFVRNVNDLIIFLDGKSNGSYSVAGITFYSTSSSSTWSISKYNNPLGCWLDELRISIGIARWTANFTPPTKEY